MKHNLDLQRYNVLYIYGNYSGILSEEARHLIMIVEHDPMLYEDATEMAEYISRGLSHSVEEVAVLLYSPESDPFLLARNADRVWYFDEGPKRQ